MAHYFDVHNHLFNKNFLGKELLYRLMKEMKKFLQVEEEKVRGITDRAGKLGKVIQALKRFRYAIRVFTRENSIAVYEELDKVYKGEFILTPLTFDLTWCFASTADRSPGADPEPTVEEVVEQEMAAIFREVEDQARPVSRDLDLSATDLPAGAALDADTRAYADLLREYQEEKDLLLEGMRKMKEPPAVRTAGSALTRGIGGIPDQMDGFQEQINQLVELKSHPDYRDMVFPFLAVDPRRPGIEEYARENVGRGKLFAGIKIYCPNGYSPTDPLLYGSEGRKDGLYAFCEENGIPVTAHNSNGGFATLSKKVKINGHIHFNGQLIRLEDEMLIFKHSILQKDAIEERAVTLNHPRIWEKVVEKHPGLILNLAHFGGGEQLGAALDNPADPDLWSNGIIKLLKDRRYRVYTDVSCFSDFNVIRKFVGSTLFAEIRSRVLYGSDFTLLLLFENDFESNVRQFRELFGRDFDVIAGDNPREFLKHVLP